VLGRGLGEEPGMGDIGESVALTPSLSFPVRTAMFCGCSRLTLLLVLLEEDWAPELGSARSLAPCACDDESSTRILRMLMASLPNVKNEKKYCKLLAFV
jgi:hypothetical protein